MTLEILRHPNTPKKHTIRAKEISSVSSPRKGYHLEHGLYLAIHESI